MKSNTFLGVILTLAGWLLISIQFAMLKHTTTEVSPFVLFFIEFLILSAIIFVISCFLGKTYLIPKNPLTMILRGIFSSLGYFAFLGTIMLSSLFDASLLLNTEALFIPLLTWAFCKQKIHWIVWIGLLIGFFGTGLAHPPDNLLSKLSLMIGLSAGLLTAIVIVISKNLVRFDAPLRIIFYHSIIATIFGGSVAFFHWKMPSIHQIGIITAAGVLFGIALWLFLMSLKFADAYLVGSLSYSLVIFSALAQWLVWHETPSTLAIFGYLFVMGGGLLVIYRSHIQSLKSNSSKKD